MAAAGKLYDNIHLDELAGLLGLATAARAEKVYICNYAYVEIHLCVWLLSWIENVSIYDLISICLFDCIGCGEDDQRGQVASYHRSIRYAFYLLIYMIPKHIMI